MIQTLIEPINYIDFNNKIAILDIETTNFQPEKSFIVEIGICELDIETGKIKKLFDNIINEKGILPFHKDSWIFSHSDLKYIDVIKSKYLDQYRDEIQKILFEYFVTAYNKSFDFGFLRHRKFIINNELVCPMITLTPITKLVPLKMGRYKYPSVEEAWKFLFPSVEYKEKHRAYDDAFHESKIVFEMINRGIFKIK